MARLALAVARRLPSPSAPPRHRQTHLILPGPPKDLEYWTIGALFWDKDHYVGYFGGTGRGLGLTFPAAEHLSWPLPKAKEAQQTDVELRKA